MTKRLEDLDKKISQLKEEIWQKQLEVRKLERERDGVSSKNLRFGIMGCENTKI